MTKDYIDGLIQRAERLHIRIGSPAQHIDREMYLSSVLEQANGLIGYILALKDIGYDKDKNT